jgi:hypothetical protein
MKVVRVLAVEKLGVGHLAARRVEVRFTLADELVGVEVRNLLGGVDLKGGCSVPPALSRPVDHPC